MIDLKPFCDTERPELSTPIDIGGGETVATNGKVMVIVASFDGDGRREVPEKLSAIQNLIAKQNWSGDPMPARNWTRIVHPKAGICEDCKGSGYVINCRECNGKGERECDMGHMHDCDECGGTGCTETPSTKDAGNSIECWECGGEDTTPESRILVPVEMFSGVFLAQDELEKVIGLPGFMFVVTPMPKPFVPVAFTFDGGRGLIMPCRATRGDANVVALDVAA